MNPVNRREFVKRLGGYCGAALVNHPRQQFKFPFGQPRPPWP